MTLDEATALVATNPKFSWDGWTLVHYEPNAAGIMKVDGVRVNGEWHVQKRFEVDSDGTYDIPPRLVGDGNGLQYKMGT